MIAIALHGGAGDRQRSTMSVKQEQDLKDSIAHALDSSYALLESGVQAVDVAEHAMRLLEDAPCFNSGIGAALNDRREAELDAGIVDGRDGSCGAVAGVKTVRSPIQAARYVMQHTQQVLIIGEAAEAMAERAGIEKVANSFFITEEVAAKYDTEKAAQPRAIELHPEKVVLGTVGIVVRDMHGNVCAANSTGGIMHKPAGRVGDTALNGCGMFAENALGAVACTGHGEFFIRSIAAHDVASRMRYAGESLETAVEKTLARIAELGGRGGIIALDAAGNITMQFNTSSMVRASRSEKQERVVEVW